MPSIPCRSASRHLPAARALALPVLLAAIGLSACDAGPTAVDETASPTISLAAPADNVVLEGEAVTIQGTASHPVGVTRIVYSLNGAAEHEVPVTSGRTVSFDLEISGLEPGSNTLSLAAYAASGNRREVERHVNRAAVRYRVVVPGGLGSGWSSPGSLNTAGQLVGWRTPGRYGAYPTEEIGFAWHQEQMAELTAPSLYRWSRAFGVNASGAAVGQVGKALDPADAEYTGQTRWVPVLWEGGHATLLPLLDRYEWGLAQAVNDDGLIVGRNVHMDRSRAVLWRNGEVIDLGLRLPAAAVGVNAGGVIIGNSWNSESPVRDRAFRWEDGELTTLTPLPYYTETIATAINDRGEIVGSSTMPESSSYILYRATLWQNDTAVDLGTVPGPTQFTAHALNNHGQVVGSMNSGGFEQAFLVDEGRMSNLSHLVPAEWSVIDATAINDAGQIAAYALHRESGNRYAVRLDPVDP